MLNLFKKFLFNLDPEHAHDLAIKSLALAQQFKLQKFYAAKFPAHSYQCMGLTFPNRIGLAAGFDKNAECVAALAAFGFGFIEVGTVTPKPQAGNPKPRLFRDMQDQAIINRMGFNSKGIEYVSRQLEKQTYQGILGINLGKNRDTPLEKAAEDYLLGFRALWPYASYVTINLSSPNTPGLRNLQHGQFLHHLLKTLKQEQRRILETQQKYVPLVVKISPDLSMQELHDLTAELLHHHLDGVIATNTTLSREHLTSEKFTKEEGGLSGKPLQKRNTLIIRELKKLVHNHLPIIACGGINDLASAQEKINAGADLLQIYTGFIFRGPELIKELVSYPGFSPLATP